MKRGWKINKFFFILLIFLSSISLISASVDYLSCNAGENCIKLYHGSTIDSTYNSVCYTIKNSHASNDYFIPPRDKTTDFQSFHDSPPSGISIANCAVSAPVTTYSGTGCDSCPFETRTVVTLGGYPHDTECIKNGNQVRSKDGSGNWYDWTYTGLRPCKEEYDCGIWWQPWTWGKICTATLDWEMKP